MLRIRKSFPKRWLLWGGVGLVCVLVAAIIVVKINTADQSSTNNQNTQSRPTAPPKITGGEMRILVAGTTFWGRRTNKAARASELGVKYPFSQLATFDRDKYDAWIAGLECPITDNGHDDYNEEQIFKFNCDPDYLSEAKKWFTAFGLGNNHIDNWGDEGIAETKRNLDANGIQYYGHYDYKNSQDNCQVLALPARIKFDNNEVKTFNLPLAFCSAHGVFGVPTEAALQNIKHYASLLPTIVTPHMGEEYKPSADTLRTNLYHKMIDYGADMVLADHPHWIQNAEAYQGKLITYSIGNFMFDQTFNQEVVRSAAIDVTAKFDQATDFAAWQSLANDCLKSQATCLNKIETASLTKLKVTWEFDFQGTTSAGDRITRRASEAETQSIAERLNWSAIMKELKN